MTPIRGARGGGIRARPRRIFAIAATDVQVDGFVTASIARSSDAQAGKVDRLADQAIDDLRNYVGQISGA